MNQDYVSGKKKQKGKKKKKQTKQKKKSMPWMTLELGSVFYKMVKSVYNVFDFNNTSNLKNEFDVGPTLDII